MIVVRKLEPADDLTTFSSGNDQLDTWVKRNGLGNQHRYGVTYVALDGGTVVGFVTVSASSITKVQLGGGGGPETWPVLLLGRMAVAKDRQGHGIGKDLLTRVFKLAFEQYMTTGCAAVVVDSKPESIQFYQKFMFKPTRVPAGAPPSPQTRMYVAVKTVLAAMKDEPANDVTPA